MSTQPFRFLDLPTELRLMIYQRLHRRIVYRHIKQGPIQAVHAVLVTRVASLAIAGNCRQIYEESKPTIASILEGFILDKSPSLVLDMATDYACMDILSGLGVDILRGLGHLQKDALNIDPKEHSIARYLASRIPLNIDNHGADAEVFIQQAARQLFQESSTTEIVRQNKERKVYLMKGKAAFQVVLIDRGNLEDRQYNMESLSLLLKWPFNEYLSAQFAFAGFTSWSQEKEHLLSRNDKPDYRGFDHASLEHRLRTRTSHLVAFEEMSQDEWVENWLE
ncbi:hypothetical protein K491DRAFT_720610 [Lophiostoma macrostomum CBS 122681]|uniref:Uncharacterized protein n=1 Tax=Lophiostoma macrostomum CBS 122681 TaxID=1314788 RepID=A0A6A6SSH4_9PLEO|nr:hypothetical protein K491DRAFT_720610 [Lophiostoma macrostomum CBS 122681]